jgi:hypothetical protein
MAPAKKKARPGPIQAVYQRLEKLVSSSAEKAALSNAEYPKFFCSGPYRCGLCQFDFDSNDEVVASTWIVAPYLHCPFLSLLYSTTRKRILLTTRLFDP